MPIIQVAFDVPDNLAAGIFAGEYQRIGGVVRYATGPHKGQIVKMLEPVDLPQTEDAPKVVEAVVENSIKTKKSSGIVSQALEIAKEHPILTVITLAGSGLAAGYGIYSYYKNREPEVMTEFRIALKFYIIAIKTGSLEMQDIERLMDALDKLKSYKNFEKLQIRLNASELVELVDVIYDYTHKLAADNEYELDEQDSDTNASPFNRLLDYLSIQKDIFESAA